MSYETQIFNRPCKSKTLFTSEYLLFYPPLLGSSQKCESMVTIIYLIHLSPKNGFHRFLFLRSHTGVPELGRPWTHQIQYSGSLTKCPSRLGCFRSAPPLIMLPSTNPVNTSQVHLSLPGPCIISKPFTFPQSKKNLQQENVTK